MLNRKAGKMKKYVIVLGLVMGSGVAISQDDRQTVMPVSVSYFGNFATHPGVKIGTEYHLKHISVLKEKKRKTKELLKSRIIVPSMSVYAHPQTKVGWLSAVDFELRRNNLSKGRFWGVGAGLGYLRQFNVGETYVVDESGSVKKAPLASKGYFSPQTYLTYGKYFGKNDMKNKALYSRLNVHYIFGYNAAMVPDFSLELGMIWNPKWGIRRSQIKKKST